VPKNATQIKTESNSISSTTYFFSIISCPLRFDFYILSDKHNTHTNTTEH